MSQNFSVSQTPGYQGIGSSSAGGGLNLGALYDDFLAGARERERLMQEIAGIGPAYRGAGGQDWFHTLSLRGAFSPDEEQKMIGQMRDTVAGAGREMARSTQEGLQQRGLSANPLAAQALMRDGTLAAAKAAGDVEIDLNKYEAEQRTRGAQGKLDAAIGFGNSLGFGGRRSSGGSLFGGGLF